MADRVGQRLGNQSLEGIARVHDAVHASRLISCSAARQQNSVCVVRLCAVFYPLWVDLQSEKPQ